MIEKFKEESFDGQNYKNDEKKVFKLKTFILSSCQNTRVDGQTDRHTNKYRKIERQTGRQTNKQASIRKKRHTVTYQCYFSYSGFRRTSNMQKAKLAIHGLKINQCRTLVMMICCKIIKLIQNR